MQKAVNGVAFGIHGWSQPAYRFSSFYHLAPLIIAYFVYGDVTAQLQRIALWEKLRMKKDRPTH